jgi:hypothetical protein
MKMAIPVSLGRVINGRFVIESVAGSGGMGTVFRAHDRRSATTVALKLYHGSSDEGTHAPRFMREAQLLAALRHPGIVSYVAHGWTAEGEPYLAMEWLDGEDLSERLRRAPLAASQSLLLLLQDHRGARRRAQRGDRSPRPQAEQRLPARRADRARHAGRLRRRPGR